MLSPEVFAPYRAVFVSWITLAVVFELAAIYLDLRELAVRLVRICDITRNVFAVWTLNSHDNNLSFEDTTAIA